MLCGIRIIKTHQLLGLLKESSRGLSTAHPLGSHTLGLGKLLAALGKCWGDSYFLQSPAMLLLLVGTAPKGLTGELWWHWPRAKVSAGASRKPSTCNCTHAQGFGRNPYADTKRKSLRRLAGIGWFVVNHTA